MSCLCVSSRRRATASVLPHVKPFKTRGGKSAAEGIRTSDLLLEHFTKIWNTYDSANGEELKEIKKIIQLPGHCVQYTLRGPRFLGRLRTVRA